MITIANTQECFVQLWRMLEPSRQPTASHSLTVPGDANGNGEVNAQDVDCLRDYILGLDPQPFSFESADLNGNGEVDIQDLTLLIEMLTE